MALTTPLGFTKLLPGEPLSANGYGFTTTNIDVIDRLIRLIMDHRHDGSYEQLSAPGAPDVDETTTEGFLRPGQTYYYRVAALDGDLGMETPAGPSSWVTISAALEAPTLSSDDVTVTTEGGSLAPGLYQYAVTVYSNYYTYDTNCPSPLTVNLSPMLGDEQIVTITLPSLPSGASGWNIYRRVPGAGPFRLVDSLVGETSEYVDDGSAVEGSRELPTRNLSGWNRSATITRPDDITGDWVIFRSTDDDDWNASRLAVVPSTDDSYLDHGDGTSFEAPYEGDSPFVNPQPISYNELSHVPHVVTFHADGASGTGALGGEWVCPFGSASVAGLTAHLDAGTTPNSDDLIAVLEVWDADDESWSATDVVVAIPEDASLYSTSSPTPLGVDLEMGTRVRVNLTQVGDSGTGATVHLKLWAVAGESWAPPT